MSTGFSFGGPVINRALRPWERVALTTEQVDGYGLRSQVIRKRDNRYKGVRYFDAVETEAFG